MKKEKGKRKLWRATSAAIRLGGEAEEEERSPERRFLSFFSLFFQLLLCHSSDVPRCEHVAVEMVCSEASGLEKGKGEAVAR